MQNFQEKFITINSYINFLPLQYIATHRISYLEFGSSNKQVIVCAHGLTRNAHDFDKLASHLAKDYKVISISYPGRGGSDYFDNKSHYNYSVYVKDSLKILEELNIKNPIWIGTSMGGIIGMIIAAKNPDLFKALVLNDIGPAMPTSTVNKISHYAGQRHYFDNLTKAKEHIKFIYNPFGIKTEEDWDYMTRYSFIQNKEGKYLMNYDPEIIKGVSSTLQNKASEIEMWHVWEKIKCKMLVIHGEKSNILLQETLDKMRQTQNFDLYSIKNVGHAPALMDEEQIDFTYEWIKKLNVLSSQ